MKVLFSIVLVLGPLFSIAQRLEEYTASNDITYRVGDMVSLGRGSGDNGTFVYLTTGGWARSSELAQYQLGATAYSNMNVKIKKIRNHKYKGAETVRFTVGGGYIFKYWLRIEEAITTCEVVPCEDSENTETETDHYQKLRELKQLLYEGIITQEEFDKEKKEILESN